MLALADSGSVGPNRSEASALRTSIVTPASEQKASEPYGSASENSNRSEGQIRYDKRNVWWRPEDDCCDANADGAASHAPIEQIAVTAPSPENQSGGLAYSQVPLAPRSPKPLTSD